MVSEVGRQPWIVYNLMKVEDAATANTGVWVTFLLVAALYIGLGVTTILILRKMSRRFRERGRRRDDDVPYGPSGPRRRRARGGRRRHEHGRRRRAVPRRHRLRRVRRGRLRRRLLGPRRRRRASAASGPAR